MRLIIGIILLAVGSYFAYDGYQLKQTAEAKIEREASTLLNDVLPEESQIKEDTNVEADIRLFGGGAVAVGGLALIIIGVARPKKR